MLFDKCKNCKHFNPSYRYRKTILSSRPKKVLNGDGCCLLLRSRGMPNYRLSTCWCKNYERKTKKKNNNNHVYNYTCPACHEILSNNEDCNYCPACGTKLDWSQNEK